MAGMLKLDPDAVVGKLIRVWVWFDKHTEDGNAKGVTYSLLDRIAGVTGFAEAMSFVGWIEQDGHNLTMPNFDVHNGKSAKKRAEAGRRIAKHRKMKRDCNAESVTKSVTREEKRREDNNKPPLPPLGEIEGLNIEAYEEWIEFRKQCKLKPYKTLARAKSLAKYSTEAQAWAVQNSIENQYQGLFPENYEKRNGSHKKQTTEYLSAFERQQIRIAGERETDG